MVENTVQLAVARPRRRGIVVGSGVALLMASLALGFANERTRRVDNQQQAQVQAEILADSIAAPLAFDDRSGVEQALKALRANPAIEAAGAYDVAGGLRAPYRRTGPPPPLRNALAPPTLQGGLLTVTAPVQEGTTRLGSVYLRFATETLLHRLMRYLGISAVVLLASLFVIYLGASEARLAEAYRKLAEEIEAREKAQAALRQAQKMEAMGQLTGGVAHDFNNLLMVASSGLELMDRTDDPVRRERIKAGIRQAIDRGASLTQQLLAFARKTPLKSEVIDLGSHLLAMQWVLERSLREDIQVAIEAEAGTCAVDVDPSQLDTAVLNIAINARDAMPNGGRIVVRLTETRGADGGAWARLSIADTGAGMAPELLARVFEPFFTTKGVGQGTGLGLSQVYGFARASGGEVDIVSRPGEGATVSLILPCSAKPLTAIGAEQQPAPGPHAPARVLLVEDDDHVAELVHEMLLQLGYTVERATNADDALDRLCREMTFDIVFSDMLMPGPMNGLDLARRIARDRPGLPVVLTTGYSAAAADAAREGLRLLPKPYRLEELGRELAAALKGGRQIALR